MSQAAIFNTDASRARTGEAFSDMFDGSAYGGLTLSCRWWTTSVCQKI